MYKRCFILTGLALLLGACQSDFPDVGDNVDKPENSHVCSRNLAAIKNYLNNVRPTATRAGAISIMPYVVNGDTVMYVANYEEGWEVFSNDNRLPMVLMKSETGSFNPYFLDRSNPFDCYFEDAAKSLQSIGIDNTENPEGMWQVYSSTPTPTPTDPGTGSQYTMVGMACETVKYEYTPKGGRLSTKWKKEYPFNQYIPFFTDGSNKHSLVGCGGVAVGQFVYFYQRYFNPSLTTVTDAVYDSSTNTYSFSGSSNSVWSLFDDGSDKEMVKDSDRMKPTALFLGYIAKCIDTTFALNDNEEEGSGSSPSTCISYINMYCGTSFFDYSFDYDKLIKTLSAGLPVFTYSYGNRIQNGIVKQTGHGYLIDFAQTEYQDIYEVYVYTSSDPTKPDINPSNPVDNPYGPSLDYYRMRYGSINYNKIMSNVNKWIKMNWGWGGESDEILINSQLSNWITYKGSTTLNFSNNRIAVIK